MSKIVSPGDPLEIRASDWNAIMQSVTLSQRAARRNGGSDLPGELESGQAFAVSSVALSPGDVAVVAGLTAGTGAAYSRQQWFLALDQPIPEDARPMAVALRPVAAGAVGVFQISGLAFVRSSGAHANMRASLRHVLPTGDGSVGLAASGCKVIAAGDGFFIVDLSGGSDTLDDSGEFKVHFVDVNGVDIDIARSKAANQAAAEGQPVPDVPIAGIECYNSALPESPYAGIARVNNQQFMVQRATHWIPESGIVQLHFIAPVEATATSEATPAECRFYFTPMEQAAQGVQSSAAEVFYPVAMILKGDDFMDIDQCHKPGPIEITWYGPCIDLLKETLQTGAALENS